MPENNVYEVRRVPAGWEHPTVSNRFLPLCRRLPCTAAQIADGLVEGLLRPDHPGYGFDMMPAWPVGEATHYQMYTLDSGGTPVSSVVSSPEELAEEMLATTGETDLTTHDDWRAFIQRSLESQDAEPDPACYDAANLLIRQLECEVRSGTSQAELVVTWGDLRWSAASGFTSAYQLDDLYDLLNQIGPPDEIRITRRQIEQP